MQRAQILDELRQTQMFEAPLSLEPIQGGKINYSYFLHSGSDRFFLKTFEFNHFAPSDRQALFFQQQRLAEFGKAAYPHYLSNAHNFQVEVCIDHVSLREANITREIKVQHLARTLWEIHQCSPVALSIDLPKDWLLYLDIAGQSDNQQLLRKIDHCKQSWIDTHKVDQVLCHNDLSFEHVTFSEPSVVFDWEYAALGNRYFDMAACAKINCLSNSEVELLQACYAQFSEIPLHTVAMGMQQQVPTVELTNELWYLAAQSVKPDLMVEK